VQRQLNVVDNWMAVKGRHQLKAGVDYRRVYPIVAPQAYSALVQFNGVGTPGGALPAGSALTGVSAGAVITASSGNRYPVFQNLSLFAQDTWKPSSRLTLTYGLRWELNPPPSESRGNDAYTVLGLDDPATATLAPRGTALYDTTYKNVAPRIGAAYQLSERSGREVVLRGGVGVFYDLGYGAIANAFGGAYPFTARKTVFNVAVPLGGADAESPAITPGPSGELTVFESGIKMPRVYQWNVSAEQALGHMQSVTVAYIGAAGRELLRKDRLYGTAFGGVLNPAVFHPQMQLQVTRNTATSDYKALQVQYQRRLSRGLQAMASYTLAESLDIASNDSFDVTAQAAAIDPKTDRGPSEFDVRHALNTAISYDLPSPAGLAAPILGGWSIDGIITARSATPVNVVYSRVIPGFGTITARPDLVPDIPLVLEDPTAPGGRRFNNTPAIVPGNPLPQIGPFLRPVQARQGSLSRNALRGFPMWQVDLALRRRVRLAGRTNLQFRAEFFNALNHPNFADPVGTLIASTFGSSTAMLGRSLGSGSAVGGFNPLYQVGGPRSIQLSAKIAF